MPPNLIQRASGLLRDVWNSVTSPVPPRTSPPRVGVVPVARVQAERMAWARKVVEKIRTAASTGHLRFLPHLDFYTGETTEIREHYRQMMKEPTIKAAVGGKVFKVAQEDFQVHPALPENERHQEAGDFTRFAVSRIRGPFLQGAAHVCWSVATHGLIDGWCVVEPKWCPEPVRWGRFAGKMVFDTVKAKDTVGLTPVVDSYRNLTGIRAGRYNAAHVFDPKDFLTWSYMPLFDSVIGTSDFRAAYRAYWGKHMAEQLELLHLDRFTGPFLHGQFNNAADRESLQAALEEARANGVLVTPVGDMVEVIDLSMKGTGDFQAAINQYDKEMLIAITGAYLQVIEGQTPDGRGDTEVAERVSDVFAWILTNMMGGIFTLQLVPMLYEVNYADVEPAQVTWGGISDVAMLKRAQLDKALQEIGLDLSAKAAYAAYGRDRPVDRSDVLTPHPDTSSSAVSGGDKGGGGGGGSGGPGGKPPGNSPSGGDSPFAPFAEPASDPEEDDPEEQAGLIADLLYHFYGPKALDHLDAALEAKGVKKFAAGWNKDDHPRGEGGKFIPRGSAEAVSAAKEVVGKVLKGDHSADADEVTKHLAILTVKQLRQLHQENGVKQIPSYVLRQHLTDAVRDRLASNKEMKGLRDAYKEAKGVRPPDTMTASALQKQIDMAGEGTPVVRGSGTKERPKAAAPSVPAKAPAPTAAKSDYESHLSTLRGLHARAAAGTVGNGNPGGLDVAALDAAVAAAGKDLSAADAARLAKDFGIARRPAGKADALKMVRDRIFSRAGATDRVSIPDQDDNPVTRRAEDRLINAIAGGGTGRGKPPAPKATGAPAKPVPGHPFAGKTRDQMVDEVARLRTTRDPDPWGLKTGAADPALSAAVGREVAAHAAAHPSENLPIPDLYDALKRRHPGLTPRQLQGELAKLAGAGGVRLVPYTQPPARMERPEFATPLNGDVHYYVSPGAKAATKPAAAPSVKPEHVAAAVRTLYDRATTATPDEIAAVPQQLASLSADQVRAVGGDLEMRFRTGESKAAMIRAIHQRIGDRQAMHVRSQLLDRPTAPKAERPPTHPERIARAVSSLDESGNNLVPLADLRDHLAKQGVTDRAAQDAAISTAQRSGHVSLSAIEGRHGVSDRHRAAAIRDGESLLGFVSLRNS